MTDAAAGPLAFTIDPAASAPPFEQLRRQVTDAVAKGALAPGTRMPTVRALAAELDLAVNTVAKAYRALESEDRLLCFGKLEEMRSMIPERRRRRARVRKLPKEPIPEG